MLRLLILYGHEERIFAVPDKEASLGSAPENDLVVRAPGVSRRHAIVRRVPGGVEVVDLGSKNGLFVEGRPVQRAVLTPGLRVQVGATWISLQEDSSSATGSDLWRLGSIQYETASTHTTDEPAASSNPASFVDALRIAYYLDRAGLRVPGERGELLARIRAAVGADTLFILGTRRRSLAVVESDGDPLSDKESNAVSAVAADLQTVSRDEVRMKRCGAIILGGRANRFIGARFADESCAREGWRKDFLRFITERLLGEVSSCAGTHGLSSLKIAAVRRTLALNEGNKSATARSLGITRQTLYTLLKLGDK
jgi:pSer/pThr/pTyr-binding forkhead associated (FHA) protein